jgi:CobQ/CobB/MinD/ParA nucleotide binding domain
MTDPLRPPRIVAVSTKGGVGKSTVTVALASLWADRTGQALIWDTDDQDEGSATAWLDATDDKVPGLMWRRGTGPELAAVVDQLAVPVFVDTPPRIGDDALRVVANLADLLVIPGSLDERRTIVQTARALDVLAPGRPYVAVITRTLSVTYASAEGMDVVRQLHSVGIPVAGSIRLTRTISSLPTSRRLPTEVVGAMADPVATDLASLFISIAGHVALAQQEATHAQG